MRPPRASNGFFMTTTVRWTTALCLALAVGTDADACSVPVFRYALERWQSDLFEVDVFHRGPLTDEQRTLVSRLEDRSLVNGGDRNWEIVDCDLGGELAADLQTVWDGLSSPALPYVVLRCPGGRQGSPIVWHGTLSDAEAPLTAAKVEQQLVRRLLSGDSVVWVLLRGSDAAQADHAAKLLTEQCAKLTEEIELPAGVGLPGSELLARIPLAARLSMLDIPADDARSSLLRRTAAARAMGAVDPATSLVLPVFGRGRAVQVLTTEELDADIIAELSRFLCGACSCQVKQLNPGFDLLLPAAWEERLYGNEVPEEAIAESTSTPATEPTYVSIPSGQSTPTASMEARPATSADDAANRAAETQTIPREAAAKESSTDWYLLVGSVLMIAALYVWRRQAAWSRRDVSDVR
jgi:hypothetical protein